MRGGRWERMVYSEEFWSEGGFLLFGITGMLGLCPGRSNDGKV